MIALAAVGCGSDAGDDAASGGAASLGGAGAVGSAGNAGASSAGGGAGFAGTAGSGTGGSAGTSGSANGGVGGGGGATCGDGACDSVEDCLNCASDCGACPAGPSHEPPGYTEFSDRPFHTKVPTLAKGEYPTPAEKLLGEGWSSTEAYHHKFTIESDPTAPSGDGLVGQMYYAPNHKAGTGPATATKHLPEGIRSVYIRVIAKLSSNWVGNQASINKMFFFGVSEGNNQFIFNAYGSGSKPLQAMLSLQGVKDDRSFLPPNLGSQFFVERGQWQTWEFLFRCNSGENESDGTMDLWIDGEHASSYDDINWTLTSHPDRPCAMSVFNWNPTFGGGGASPGVAQYQWFDHVYISGK